MKKVFKTLAVAVIAVLTLAVAQSIAWIIGDITVSLGMYDFVEAIIVSLLYPLLAYFGVKLIFEKGFKYSLKDFRITKPCIKWYWAAAGLMLPLLVVGCFLLFVNGSWTALETDVLKKAAIIIYGVFYYSIAAGIVEEMIFRGVIMGALENEFNPWIAVILPSVLFGAVHMIGASLNVISIIQLLIAGTFVGIMFSLIERQSGSFWNNAIVHALWNMTTIGLMHIGSEVSSESLHTYVINTDNVLLSGGEFGVEASLIAIAGYSFVILMALILIKNKMLIEK